MNDFDLSIQEGKVMAGSTDIPMLIEGVWFVPTCRKVKNAICGSIPGLYQDE